MLYDRLDIIKDCRASVMMPYGRVTVHIRIIEGGNYTPWRHASVVFPELAAQIIWVLNDFAYKCEVHDYAMNMKPHEWLAHLEQMGDVRYEGKIWTDNFCLPLN